MGDFSQRLGLEKTHSVSLIATKYALKGNKFGVSGL